MKRHGKDGMKVHLEIHVHMSVVKLPETRMYWAKYFLFDSFGIRAIMPKDWFDKILQYSSYEQWKCHATKRAEKLVDKLLSCQASFGCNLKQIEYNYVPYKYLSLD